MLRGKLAGRAPIKPVHKGLGLGFRLEAYRLRFYERLPGVVAAWCSGCSVAQS